jgi:hypothetical protein
VSAREHVAPIWGEIIEPSTVRVQEAVALASVCAMIAAERDLSAMEREDVIRFVRDLGLAAYPTKPRLAATFDERARRLEQRELANLVIDALLPVFDPSHSPDLRATSKRAAVSDETLHSHEVLAIKLLRLLRSRLPRAKSAKQTQRASSAEQRSGV